MIPPSENKHQYNLTTKTTLFIYKGQGWEGKACLNCLGPFPTWSRMPFLTFASQPGALQVPGLQGGENVVRTSLVLSKAQFHTKDICLSTSPQIELRGLKGTSKELKGRSFGRETSLFFH